MDPNRATDRILDEWDAVSSTARAPLSAPRRRGAATGLASSLGLAGAGVLAAALVIGVVWLGGRIAPGVAGPETTPPAVSAAAQASQVAVAPTSAPSQASSHPTASRAPSSPPTARPTATPTPIPPVTPSCSAATVSARITAWEGAAGSRIADVTVTNTSSGACALPEPTSLALRDGSGRTLVTGAGPSGGATHLAGGASATTLVEVSNYCGAPPVAPVTIRFDLGAGDRVTAEPPSPADATVPPCNGSTVAASIQMHPWSR